MIKYSTEQLDFLRAGYRSMKIQDLTRAFNRQFNSTKSEKAIKAALNNHKIHCGRKPKDRLVPRRRMLTKDQDQLLRDNYTFLTVKELTLLLNERFQINLKPSQIKNYVKNHGIKSGRTGYFKKGHTPAIKGTKGLTGANPGSFKPGNVPPNRKPMGAERICSKDGYILKKIKEVDPYTGFGTRYRLKHIHIWEQANGPVPEGQVVAFIDGDKTNCRLENLMLISRLELLNLNQLGYKDMPGALKPSALALAKLRAKTSAVERGNNGSKNKNCIRRAPR